MRKTQSMAESSRKLKCFTEQALRDYVNKEKAALLESAISKVEECPHWICGGDCVREILTSLAHSQEDREGKDE